MEPQLLAVGLSSSQNTKLPAPHRPGHMTGKQMSRSTAGVSISNSNDRIYVQNEESTQLPVPKAKFKSDDLGNQETRTALRWGTMCRP